MQSSLGKRKSAILRKIGLIAGLGIFLSFSLPNAARAANYAVLTFTVSMDVSVPVIYHKPLKLINIVGNNIIIKASASDDAELASVALFYKKHSGSSYTLVVNNIEKSKKNYDLKVTIPSNEIDNDGMDYYITATDRAGNTVCFSGAGYSGTVPSVVIPISVEVKTVNIGAAIGSEGSTVSMEDANPDDGQTSLTVPANALSTMTNIFISQIYDVNSLPTANAPGKNVAWTKRPVAAYKLTPEGLSLARLATLTMLYFDLDRDGLVDGTNIKNTDLRLFRWDGFEWRYVGGTVDQLTNTVTSEISRLGTYALFPAKELMANDYRPKNKIITPATADGVNDVAEFDGLQGKKVTIRIFDATGKKVRTISNEPYEWNGRDDEERLVESGVYIYQLEVDGQMISGMIAVAK